MTPGPWYWVVNPKHHTVELSRGQYGDTVMRFCRWGMRGAQPLFNVGGILRPASELSTVWPGREHHADWWRALVHPDAQAIAATPDLAAALQETRDALRWIEASRTEPRPDDERGRNAMAELRRVIAVADAALEKAGVR